jgi:hypothetical protein
MSKQPTKSFRPTVQTLDHRAEPSVTLDAHPDLRITAPVGVSDTVTVSRVGSTYKVTENYVSVFVPVSEMSGGDVVFVGSSGNDNFQDLAGLRTVAGGVGGVDILSDGSSNDLLVGGSGLDFLDGRGGNDGLHGGLDGFNDVVVGGTGIDYLEVEYAGNQVFDFLQGFTSGVDVRIN